MRLFIKTVLTAFTLTEVSLAHISTDPNTVTVTADDSNNNSQGPWKRCVGMTGEECQEYIKRTVPDLEDRVYIIGHDQMATMDYRLDRVRIFVNENGVVERVPKRG
mmetsp:Transcript_616/g.822  ORF Transcript_616/g.822 Transcript_616/m.822 type:complete len:106 (-) Transcript_616:126-443(-)|eukprot:CAMPEP_0172496482 /NCGR_PEP_ID=MMETSP1066-20121228/87992_1 /TAXON_ID=671091 /ORGANISM="Coscinodiscus wailesii, Strain CCMP2513" /LENGTH=105 /DNA_ID=CAMNT_0013268805 /DNA_START=72 /DNA_END=389 /DNA_ORIENTATION=+